MWIAVALIAATNRPLLLNATWQQLLNLCFAIEVQHGLRHFALVLRDRGVSKEQLEARNLVVSFLAKIGNVMRPVHPKPPRKEPVIRSRLVARPSFHYTLEYTVSGGCDMRYQSLCRESPACTHTHSCQDTRGRDVPHAVFGTSRRSTD